MTDWQSALGMLLGGLILGGLFLYSMSRRKAPASAPDLDRRDLEAQRDLVLQELRGLPNDPSNAEERSRLERKAADILRKLEAKPATGAKKRRTTDPEQPAAAPVPTGNSALRGFLWGAGSMAALALLFFFVWTSAKQRGADDSLTGNTGGGPMQAPQQQQQPQSQSDPELQQLEAAVAKSPDDVSLRDDLAKAYLDRDNMMAGFEQTKIVLEKAPNDSRALTYQALVRLAMGQNDVAMAMMQRATQSDPALIDAWIGLAWVQMRTGKEKDAERSIGEAAKRHPQQAARLQEVLVQMKARAREAALVEAGQLPANHPPVDGAPQQAPAAPAPAPAAAAAAPSGGGSSVHVTLSMAPGTAAPPNGVIYVIARAAGVTAGPPVAVKRLAASSFPITLDLSAADSMMGQPLPEKIRIEARLDSDGDAMTKNPSDPKAEQDGVAVGGSVALVLK